MQPEQAPPSTNGNPYTFITNPAGAPVKKPGFSGGVNDMQRRIIIVAGLVVLLIICAVVFSSIISNANKGNLAQLTSVLQDQAEIVHIAALMPAEAVNQSTKNVTATVTVTMPSAESQLLSLIKKEGHKISTTQQDAKELKSIDNQINTAIQVSQYDQVFLGILQTQLTQYENDLKAAYAAKPNIAQANLLKTDYNGAVLLQTMTTNAISSLSQ
jgi:hypothetical protein